MNQANPTTAQHNSDWYLAAFLPTMRKYRKRSLVWGLSLVYSEAFRLIGRLRVVLGWTTPSKFSRD